MKHVIVYAEHRGGKTRKVTFEMATRGAQTRRCAGRQSVTPSSLGTAAQASCRAAQSVSTRRRCTSTRMPTSINFCSTRSWTISNKPLARVGPSLVLVPNTLSGTRRRRAPRCPPRCGNRCGRYRLQGRNRARRMRFAENGRRPHNRLRDQTGRLRNRDRAPECLCRRCGGSGAAVQPLEKPTEKTYTTTVERRH